MSAQSAPSGLNPDAMRGHADDAAQLLRALASNKRLLILCLLAQGERSVGQLNALLDLSQSALSQHLAILRTEGIVQTRRQAQTIHYSLVQGPAFRIIQALYGIYCAPAQNRPGKAEP